jgi:hypothetical protein
MVAGYNEINKTPLSREELQKHYSTAAGEGQMEQ